MNECDTWRTSPDVNPRTQRRIKKDGPVYKQLQRACSITKDDCDAWKQDPTRHPVTKRKLRMHTKSNGIYNQLVMLCKDPIQRKDTKMTKPSTVAKKPKKQKSKKAQPPSNSTPVKRAKLANALKKVLAPVLERGNTTQSRLKYSQIIRRYVKDIEPCLSRHPTNQNVVLLHKVTKEQVVVFDKRIGSDSAYGMAYMNMGKGFARMLKFSCKLMRSDKFQHTVEVFILKHMTQMVEDGICPNMPITYLAERCYYACVYGPMCPAVTRQHPYYVVINELANGDLQTWFQKEHSQASYESILMQMVFAIECFHNMGYVHQDTHLANFLVHTIKPGGYWRYRVFNTDVYVPNTGVLLVLWDPGMAKVLKNKYAKFDDFLRPLSLILKMANIYHYQQLGMKPMKGDVEDIVHQLHSLADDLVDTPFVKSVLEQVKFNHVQVGGTPPGVLLNVKPYTLIPSKKTQVDLL